MSLLTKVESGPDACSTCGGQLEKLYAMIAFSAVGRGAVVVACSRHVACDMREAGIDAGDVFAHQDMGELTVWEGRIVVSVTPSSPNGPEEFDYEYVGTFREPTEDELRAVLRGENPFEESRR